MKVAMQIEREALSKKYLGLPTASERLTDKRFEHIVESSRSRARDGVRRWHPLRLEKCF
jgi:hypothetical protein